MCEDIFYMIGLFVVSAAVFAIPILTTCAFIYNWDGCFKLVLLVLSIIDFCIIILGVSAVAEEADKL